MPKKINKKDTLKSKIHKNKKKYFQKLNPKGYQSFKLYVDKNENDGFSWTFLLIVIFLVGLIFAVDQYLKNNNISVPMLENTVPAEIFNEAQFIREAGPDARETSPSDESTFIQNTESSSSSPSSSETNSEDFIIDPGETSGIPKSKRSSDFVSENSSGQNIKTSNNSSGFISNTGGTNSLDSTDNSSNFVSGNSGSGTNNSSSSGSVFVSTTPSSGSNTPTGTSPEGGFVR